MAFTRIAAVWTHSFLIASLVGAQSSVSGAKPEGRTAAPVAPTVLVVPAGTSVPLVLITTIRSKSSKPGESVRARVAFPITVDDQVAIPSGTYVEGTIVSVRAHAGGSGVGTVQIRFDRLLYANGYAVSLDAVGSQAQLVGKPAGELASLDPGAGLNGFGFDGQSQPPTLPPLPQVGPSKAAVIGGAAAGAGVIVALAVITSRHRRHSDYILFDSGAQFRMVLRQALTLDPAEVKASVAVAGTGTP